MDENEETGPVNETPGFIKDVFDGGKQNVIYTRLDKLMVLETDVYVIREFQANFDFVGAIFSAYSVNHFIVSLQYRTDRNSIFCAATVWPH